MSKQLSVEEQEVRDLIAGAGPRAEPPAEELAKIRAAAHAEWREMVERERRRGRRMRVGGGLALAASVVLAAAVGWWWAGRTPPAAAAVVASVELVAGTARAADAELAVGGALAAGTTVETGGWLDGAPPGVALRLAGGQSLRLAADTRVHLVAADRFELDRGTLYIDSGPAAHGGVAIVTALGTVRDVGTQFEVRLSDSGAALRVRVREGEVALEAGGESHRAVRGEQLSLLGDEPPARAAIETWGSEWDWVVATAPGIRIDGRSVHSALAWVGRETGREVRYADAGLEAEARQNVIRGPFDGFTPEQTLDTALRVSGLRHELENGSILVTR